ncbi:MAG TPA: DUF488 domain-containing protein [Gammaproteobacteria bacterium]|nr:DUF488 domain-containing protein [Gammaproteobacteria bacterium]
MSFGYRLDQVFTVGHSTHPIERFIGLLERFAVTCVCDVRSSPYSRRNPHFNREALRDSLNRHAISYTFLGAELGGRTKDDSCYVDGKVQYAILAATPSFREGLQLVLEESRVSTVALMCAEKEPLDCHRTILVARHLSDLGVEIEHILATGESERHQDTINRLVDLLKLDRADLFLTEREVVDRAYRLRAEEIAYQDTKRAS